MAWSPSSPVTGGAQTGFTSPTYTLVADVAPTVNGKQNAVSALGGTQVGVTIHSIQSPFTITFVRPSQFRYLGKTNPVTGLLPSVPKNQWKVIVRKGVTPLAGQPVSPLVISCTMDIPAGADSADPANIRAAVSLLCGVLTQIPAGLGDSLVSGVM